MSDGPIKLGDEVEDVTSKLTGIAIGYTKYLSGAKNWIIQPFTTDDNVMINSRKIPEAYCRRIGDGVCVQPKPPMGFTAFDVGVKGNGKSQSSTS